MSDVSKRPKCASIECETRDNCTVHLMPPLFILTIDVDWASEYCIATLMEAMRERGIIPVVHVTHKSEVLSRMVEADEVVLGIHPNFLPGSSHGTTIGEVFDHVFALAPNARIWRSHALFDQTAASTEAARRGILYRSNTFAWLEPNLRPVRHFTNLLEFPIFWEDDVHLWRGEELEPSRFFEAFLTPGLKVLNLHPFFFALNCPSMRYYRPVRMSGTEK